MNLMTKKQSILLGMFFLLFTATIFGQKIKPKPCINGVTTLAKGNSSTYHFTNPTGNASNVTWTAYGGINIIGYGIDGSVQVEATDCGVGLLEVNYCYGGGTKASDCCNRCVLEINVPIEGCCSTPVPDCELGVTFQQLVCQGGSGSPQGAIWVGFEDPETQTYCEEQVVSMCWDWSQEVLSVGPNGNGGMLTTPGSCINGWQSRWDFFALCTTINAQLTLTVTFADGTVEVINFDIPNDCPPCPSNSNRGSVNELELYPNPTSSDNINIRYELIEAKSNVQINFIDVMTGRIVYAYTLDNQEAGIHNKQFNLPGKFNTQTIAVEVKADGEQIGINKLLLKD